MEERFQRILNFLTKYQELIDCHLVDFISEDLWNKCLPQQLRLELEDIRNCNDIWEQRDDTKQLYNFISATKSLSLESCPDVIDLKDLPHLLFNNDNNNWIMDIDIRNTKLEFMNKKKLHEVKIFGNVIGRIACSTNGLVVDAGAGKAYLSTYISDSYEVPVLAIDSSNVCHKAAICREAKMKKKGSKSLSLVKYVVEKLNDETDYSSMIRTKFPDWNTENNLILTGLHTCGSLVHSLIKVFLRNKDFRIFCVVPCCYHLANESFNKGINFSKNARMLAQQSIERSKKIQSLSPTLFYRAVLQIFLRSIGLEDAKVGRGGPVHNFPTYAKWALSKIDINSSNIPSETSLEELYQAYVKFKEKLDIFQTLRIYISTVIEAAIILDRVLYLKNSGQCSKSAILSLFDAVLSPRRYAIIAIR